MSAMLSVSMIMAFSSGIEDLVLNLQLRWWIVAPGPLLQLAWAPSDYAGTRFHLDKCYLKNHGKNHHGIHRSMILSGLMVASGTQS